LYTYFQVIAPGLVSAFSPRPLDLILSVSTLKEPKNEVFLAIAKAMKDNVVCYRIIGCFVNQLNNKYWDSLPQLVVVHKAHLLNK
jgi:hypothetical protein